jgi:hypothetical protein
MPQILGIYASKYIRFAVLCQLLDNITNKYHKISTLTVIFNRLSGNIVAESRRFDENTTS